MAAYWVALVAGVSTPFLTRWGLIVLLTAPGVLVLYRAAAHRERRFAWTVLGTGLISSGIGWILQPQATVAPVPGLADGFWLAAYPCYLATFAALARPWLRRAPRKLALDGAAIMLATAGVAIALVLPNAAANPGRLTGIEQLVNFAYPAADCVLLTVALIGAAVAGWRAGPAWSLLAVGIVALVTGDILWALHAADGTWNPIMSSNAIYPIWAWLAAAAVYAGREIRWVTPGAVRTHAAALVAAIAALVLLVANEWVEVPALSTVLAGFALLAAIHRTGLALADGVRQSLAAAREREIVDQVRHALAHGELDLHYQPLVDARTGTVKGAEALLRWSRDGVNIAPDQFLPAVERSELMAPLTDYVLDRALAQAATWGGLGVSVNLATANLSEPDLPARVIAALRRNGVPPSKLTLEITETAAVEDSVMADQVLAALDSAGVGLSVDDFGTGHSSIVRLARFPIREVKIDRSFVREMHTSQRPIVATTIALAHALGLRVVAEGIEDAGTLLALRELGCDLAQGYHISRPLTAAGFAAWLAADDRRAGDLGLVDLDRHREGLGLIVDVPAANLEARTGAPHPAG
ncbi:EAL domain-containing protein [Solirubrobacter ginsenosidimutans]|uniref:EAL domain-containing protein n=1 Tax=Solirubrobacter ginsenosidimutans TaxID=490573 RepID=A0A9X3MT43_9ACTN|nr:EAL domain-containing protein [Solirubrobacter ginsenosidimutans]